ncbi:MAG: hypothetical protein HYX75_01075 [Acidobacteria bacterium]|nr:hypothetical protein [Acidobacteriota bacterium]
MGTRELDLIRASGYAAFPPRLPGQPIFYPVLTEDYAVQIARDWNVKQTSDHRGYVTKFSVRRTFLNRFEAQTVGGARHIEYWIPADQLPELNNNIVGSIEVIAEYSAGQEKSQ